MVIMPRGHKITTKKYVEKASECGWGEWKLTVLGLGHGPVLWLWCYHYRPFPQAQQEPGQAELCEMMKNMEAFFLPVSETKTETQVRNGEEWRWCETFTINLETSRLLNCDVHQLCRCCCVQWKWLTASGAMEETAQPEQWTHDKQVVQLRADLIWSDQVKLPVEWIVYEEEQVGDDAMINSLSSCSINYRGAFWQDRSFIMDQQAFFNISSQQLLNQTLCLIFSLWCKIL